MEATGCFGPRTQKKFMKYDIIALGDSPGNRSKLTHKAQALLWSEFVLYHVDSKGGGLKVHTPL